jgi:2-methylisocitrate lyase-like PEP mutase family enzyme
MYKIKGQYKLFSIDVTTYLSADGDLFLIEKSSDKKTIKRFTKDVIQDFVVSNGNIEKKTYVTDKYLQDNGFTTTSYVDSKLTALEQSIRNNISKYVSSIVDQTIENKIDTLLDKKLDAKLDEKIHISTDEEVKNFFT